MATTTTRICAAAGATLVLALAAPAAADEGAITALERDGRFDAFVAAARASGVASLLSASDEGRTIFAPTDEAFARLPDAVVAALARPDDGALGRLVARHVVPEGPHPADALPETMRTLGGETLTVRMGSGVTVAAGGAEAEVVAPGIAAENVLVHGIGGVLLAAADGAENAARAKGRADRADFVDAIAAVDEDRSDGALVPETDAPFAPSRPGEGEAADGLRLSADDMTVIALGGDLRDRAPGLADAGRVVTLPAEVEEPMMARLSAANRSAEDTANRAAEDTARRPAETGAPAREAPAPQEDAGEADEAADARHAPAGEPALDLSRETLSLADLLGRDVRDPSGERIGEVADVRLSLVTGAATRIVVEMDAGFLGLFDETASIDPGAVAIDPLDGAVIVERSALGGGDGSE